MTLILLCLALTWLFIRYAGTPENPPGSDWYASWQRWLQARLPEWLSRLPVSADIHAALLFIIVAIVPALVLGLFLNLLSGWLWGLLVFLGSLLALIFSCGRIDYDTEMIKLSEEARQSQDHNNRADDVVHEYSPNLAYASYDRWFSAAFWFLVFGPVLSVIYRCVSLLAGRDAGDRDSDESGETADMLLVFLDWLPVRLWGLMIVLMGDFSVAWAVYRQRFLDTDHAELLHALTQASLPEGSTGRPEWFEKILGLNDRVMLVGLLLLCLPIIF